MHLVGVDIGFSERRRSNGIAVLRDGKLIRAERLSVAERDAALRELKGMDVVAIDAPLLPRGTADTLPRHCERVFSRGLFQKRCKPGMSHIRGTGQSLREHGRRAAEQLLAPDSFRPSEHPLERVWLDVAIVEAFPNAFLGVVVPDNDYATATKIKRGGKFDWLYDRWIDRGLFPHVVAAAQLPNEIAIRCETEKDHDIRAALICLLTAAFAANGTAVAVGQDIDGYFFLPPAGLWAGWAETAVAATACDIPPSNTRSRSPASNASSPHAQRPDSC
jgi:predicted nuclease with RNAse H fold